MRSWARLGRRMALISGADIFGRARAGALEVQLLLGGYSCSFRPGLGNSSNWHSRDKCRVRSFVLLLVAKEVSRVSVLRFKSCHLENVLGQCCRAPRNQESKSRQLFLARLWLDGSLGSLRHSLRDVRARNHHRFLWAPRPRAWRSATRDFFI